MTAAQVPMTAGQLLVAHAWAGRQAGSALIGRVDPSETATTYKRLPSNNRAALAVP